MQMPDYEGNLITKELDGNYIVTKSHRGEIINIQELDFLVEGKKTKYGIIKSIKKNIVIFDNNKTATKETLNSYIAKSLSPIPQSTPIKGTYITPNGLKIELQEHSPDLRLVITNPDYMRENSGEILLRKSNTTIIVKKKPLFNEAIIKSVVIKGTQQEEKQCIGSGKKKQIYIIKGTPRFNFMKYSNKPADTTKVEMPETSTGARWNVKGGEKPGHKYIQRKPNKTNDGWIYLYKLPNGDEEWHDEDGNKVDDDNKVDNDNQTAKILPTFPSLQQGDKIIFSGLNAKVLEVSDNFIAVLDERGTTTTIDKTKYLEKQKLWENYKVGQKINYKGKNVTITRKTDLVITIRDDNGDLVGVIQKPASIKKLSSSEYSNNRMQQATNYKNTEEYKVFNINSNNHGFTKVNDFTREKYFRDGDETHKITWVYNAGDKKFDVLIDGEESEYESDGGRLIDVDTDGAFIYQMDNGSLERRERHRAKPNKEPEEEKVDTDKIKNIEEVDNDQYQDSIFAGLFDDEEETKQDEKLEEDKKEEDKKEEEQTINWKDKIDEDFEIDDVVMRTGFMRKDGSYDYTFKLVDGRGINANMTKEEVAQMDADFRKHAVNRKILQKMKKKDLGTNGTNKKGLTKAEIKKQEMEEQARRELEESAKRIKEVQESDLFKQWQKEHNISEENGYKLDGTRATKKKKFGDYDFTILYEYDKDNIAKLPKVKGPTKTVILDDKVYHIVDIQEIDGKQSLLLANDDDISNKIHVDIDTLQEVNGKGLFRPEDMKGIKSNKPLSEVFITGEPYKVEYEIIEADELHVSHDYDPGADVFIDDKNYKLPQNRTYTSQSDKEKVLSISMDPKFELLADSPVADVGSPIVTGDYQAVGGNGRGMGIKLGYSSKGGEYQYKKDLLANAERLGFDKEKVGRMKHPVLVRKLVNVSNEEAGALAGKTNVSAMAAQSPFEIAAAKVNSMEENDKMYISGKISSKLHELGGDATLTDVLNKLADDIGHYLVERSIIAPNEKSNYADDNGNFIGEKFKDIALNIALGGAAKYYDKVNNNIKTRINRAVPYLMLINSKKRDKFKNAFENGLYLARKYKEEAKEKETLEEYLKRKQDQVIGDKLAPLSQYDIAMADALANDKVETFSERFHGFYASNVSDELSFVYEEIEDEEEALKKYFIENDGEVLSEAAKAFPNGIKLEKSIFTKLLKYFRR